MEPEKKQAIKVVSLFLCVFLVLSATMYFAVVCISLPWIGNVERDLKLHLHTGPPITIISIEVIKQDTEGLWFFKVDCFNNEEHALFSTYGRFNFQTKELIGSNNIKYI